MIHRGELSLVFVCKYWQLRMKQEEMILPQSPPSPPGGNFSDNQLKLESEKTSISGAIQIEQWGACLTCTPWPRLSPWHPMWFPSSTWRIRSISGCGPKTKIKNKFNSVERSEGFRRLAINRPVKLVNKLKSSTFGNTVMALLTKFWQNSWKLL